jgi:AMMECR1 domain-containing protein
VAVEHRWDRVTFLNHVCLKAGLKADAWRHGALLSTFEAEVFGDQRPYDRS